MKKMLIFLVIFTVASLASFVTVQSPESLSIGSFSKFLPSIEIMPEEQKPTSLSLVGDVFLGRRVETYLDTYGSDYVYSNLPSLSSTTVLVGNFESSIPKEHTQTPDMTFSFSVKESHVPALSGYGFSYMNLANNHSFDKGATDFVYTQEVLAKNNITPFGSPVENATTSVAYVSLEGRTVALIGVYAVETQPSDASLRQVIDSASSISDFQVVYVHWGIEYQQVHSPTQEVLAHTMIDFGADAVIGHHPHVVQDIELYNDVPIFYSLGNFIFDQYFNKEVQEGLWVTLSFEHDTPVYVLQGITSIGSRSVPRFMSSYENEFFLKDIAKKSTPALKEMIQSGGITIEQ